jgi:alkanesulfonate monooxygenase SsuD/methylene tetrahydromethanopterin reductase-like flavin-dependent oxidoreductase (luciferase family)
LIATKNLLEGKTVTMSSDHLQLADARLDGFTNEHRIELLVGGSHPLILAAGAQHADIVALSGLGRTLPDGHSHETNWTGSALEAQLKVIRQTAERVKSKPVIEALVHEVTLKGAVSAEAPSPFALVGGVPDMIDQIRLQAAEYNITKYVVREPDIDVVERVIENLRDEG